MNDPLDLTSSQTVLSGAVGSSAFDHGRYAPGAVLADRYRIIGLLGLAFRLEVSPGLAKTMLSQPAMLPAAVFIPAVLGLIFQQTHGPAEGGGGVEADGGVGVGESFVKWCG